MLEGPFIRSARPTPLSLATAGNPIKMWGVSPFTTLWKAIGEHFRDPRLRQLFGRYATYSGSSPYRGAGHADADRQCRAAGRVAGGGRHHPAWPRRWPTSRRLKGVNIRVDAPVAEIVVRNGRAAGVKLADGERIEADAVVCDADFRAIAAGAFGRAAVKAVPQPKPNTRSLSAVTWALSGKTEGFPLARHNVFFAANFHSEFDDSCGVGRLPGYPTVYVCAQDRGEPGQKPDGQAERLLVLVNAPANRRPASVYCSGDRAMREDDIRPVGTVRPDGGARNRSRRPARRTSSELFPATGGALYGQAVHGSMAAFRRPGSRSAMPGLYLAGGSVHPGPGVPMAVLSGRLAADSAAGGPDFSITPPPRGYVWWYVDALSDDGRVRHHPDRVHRQRVLARITPGRGAAAAAIRCGTAR